MTPEERKNAAEQLIANPLYEELMAGIESAAVERLVYADTDILRVEGQAHVRAARSFREDCEAALRNNQYRRGAPA